MLYELESSGLLPSRHSSSARCQVPWSMSSEDVVESFTFAEGVWSRIQLGPLAIGMAEGIGFAFSPVR